MWRVAAVIKQIFVMSSTEAEKVFLNIKYHKFILLLRTVSEGLVRKG